MVVSFNPSINYNRTPYFKGEQKATELTPEQLNVLQNTLTPEQIAAIQSAMDMYNKQQAQPEQQEPPKEKKTFKGFIGNVAKFFVNAKEMIVGAVKGVLYGGVTGAAILGVDRLISGKPKTTLKGGAIATVATTGILAYQVIKARLTANKGTANIDHQLHLGHRDK